MKTATDISVLRQKARNANERLMDAEEEKRNRVGRPKLRKLVGKCFVYSNRYSDGPSWPLYARIVGFDEGKMTFQAVEFQRTALDRIEIEERRTHNFEGQSRFSIESGWTPITVGKYDRAVRELLRVINKLLNTNAEMTDFQ